MSEWWEVGYKGGPPVDVKFPRPVYPPDAAQYGKKPSNDGPDILAYKRAICRAGRWGDWAPDTWDDSYSNNFSHGKGPNVKDTGIAGFQRQQHLDDTGWIGQKTFENMRYALISDPSSPNYLSPIFDGPCIQNLDKAFAIYGGNPEPPDDAGTVRESALEKAITQLGYEESPPNSNNNKFGSWYGMNGQPWCAMFVTWCFELNDVGPSPSFVRGSRYSYVPYLVGDARAGRYGLVTTSDPKPGDLVCYDWSGDTIFDHIGIFEAWQMGAGDFTAIEGNTSVSNDSNGGEVMRRNRNRNYQPCVFVRVKEPA